MPWLLVQNAVALTVLRYKVHYMNVRKSVVNFTVLFRNAYNLPPAIVMDKFNPNYLGGFVRVVKLVQ